ncbi:macro domain-containing protein [bacterium]|nr:macro domain-containing protein [bacterium]
MKMSQLLTYIVKDLIDAAKDGDINVLAHGCNCYNTMGSGIAPLIAKAFPAMHEVDQRTTKGDEKKLGNLTGAVVSENLVGFNLYSQYGYWGRNKGEMDLDYDALESALIKLRDRLQEALHKGWLTVDPIIGLPKIGAGLAGGDWEKIEKIIHKQLTQHGYEVIIYVLNQTEIPQ